MYAIMRPELHVYIGDRPELRVTFGSIALFLVGCLSLCCVFNSIQFTLLQTHLQDRGP